MAIEHIHREIQRELLLLTQKAYLSDYLINMLITYLYYRGWSDAYLNEADFYYDTKEGE